MAIVNKEIAYHLFIEPVDGYKEDGFAEYEMLSQASIDDIFSFIIDNKAHLRQIDTYSIPQFSQWSDVFKVLHIIADAPVDNLDREKIGYFLCPKSARSSAKLKYGENHHKLAIQLSLAVQQVKPELTELGQVINMVPDEKTKVLSISKLALRIPFIQQILIEAQNKNVNGFEYLTRYLSPSTARRRRSSIKALLRLINAADYDGHMQNIIWNIKWEEEKDELS